MLDISLCSLLLLVLPVRALIPPPSPRPIAVRLRSSVAIIAALLMMLAAALAARGLGHAAVGLALPDGFGLMLIALMLPIIAGMAWAVRRAPPQDHAMIPTTTAERRWFALFAVTAGFGWEALYRGYLLLVLPPVTGLPAAIALAAVAYALGHGVTGWRGLAGALVAALGFTLAYGLTGTLWWLVVLHTGLAFAPLLARPPATRS